MAPIYLVLALVIQCSFIHADTEISDDKAELLDDLQKPDLDDNAIDSQPSSPINANWFDMFVFPDSNTMFPSPSASMMNQVANSNKTLEEQLKDIKELAKEISDAIETEMVNLFSYAIADEKENKEKGARKRRSAESPMDSTQMVMRLLKHIKSNNEYQNIAIDKMMSAQEIAEKFGIEFSPDPEILSDLAIAANEHAQEMTNMLKDACDLKNVTVDKVSFVPVEEEPKKTYKSYYSYDAKPERITEKTYGPSYEYVPEVVSKPQPVNHVHCSDPYPYYNYPYESQISSPPVHLHHSAPVTPKPTFYDQFIYPYSPASDYSPYCSVESAMPVLLIPMEEELEPEPELVSEVVEETVTSKMIVEKGDEPGATTVNHVTSYTISEKSHFKPPQIEKLPQQLQYCFYLI